MDIQSLQHSIRAVNPGRYLKSAFWLTSSRLLSMVVSLAATFYIARTLGPQNFGELSYAQSVLAILTVLSASIGALYRDIVRRPEEESRLLGTAWCIHFITSLISVLMTIMFALLLPHDRLTVLILGILCLTQFFSPFSIIQNIFYAKTETKWLSIVTLGLHIFISTLKILVMLSGQGVVVLAGVLVLEQALMAIGYVLLYHFLHHGSLFTWKFDPTYARQLLIDSLPIVFVAASGIIAARIDQLFIKHFLDMTSVGLYGVAIQLSEIWQFVPGILLTAVFPAIINARVHRKTYKRRLGLLIISLASYGIAIASLLTIFAPAVIELIYGPAYSGASEPLRIYIWSLVGMILGLLSTQFLLAENQRTVQMVSASGPLILNIILNIYLIPRMGMSGAAIATVVSYSLYPIFPLLFKRVRHTLGINF